MYEAATSAPQTSVTPNCCRFLSPSEVGSESLSANNFEIRERLGFPSFMLITRG